MMGVLHYLRRWWLSGVALPARIRSSKKWPRLHNDHIMAGGGLYLCWMGYQMPRGALKKQDAAASSAH